MWVSGTFSKFFSPLFLSCCKYLCQGKDVPAHLTQLTALKHNDNTVTMGLAALSCEAVTKAPRRRMKAGFLALALSGCSPSGSPSSAVAEPLQKLQPSHPHFPGVERGDVMWKSQECKSNTRLPEWGPKLGEATRRSFCSTTRNSARSPASLELLVGKATQTLALFAICFL